MFLPYLSTAEEKKQKQNRKETETKQKINSLFAREQIGQSSIRLGRVIPICFYVASLSGRFLTDQTITALRLRFVRRYPYLSPKD